MGIFGQGDVLFKGQKYSSLRKQAQSSGQLFKDPEFPATSASISKSGAADRSIEWKRPKDICDDPKLVVDGVSSQDLIQGEVGNCWFVASCGCLAVDKTVWAQVVPDVKDQDWDSENPDKYAGIFHFRFWRYGAWMDVVVDDLLPCRGKRLIFVHSKTKNEFWSALLEKAYAKLYGSYDALDGGELSEALEDFTGGVSETFDLQAEKYYDDPDKKEEFFTFLYHQFNDHALMSAAIPAKRKEDMERPTEMGLVMGHAYSVTAVRKVTMKGTGLFSFLNREKIPMIRLRNPWGGSEWTGAFSDKSEEWSKITNKERQNIGLTFDEDGEFWMTFDDFCQYFVNLAVCHMVNLSIFSLQKRWFSSEAEEEWAKPHRCGGCINNKDTFLNNPQFTFMMTEDDDAIIVLTQKNTKESGEEKSVIGFTLLKVEENRAYRVHRIGKVVASSTFRNSRSVLLRRKLDRGRYVAVATKFDPNDVGPFLIRFFLGCNSRATELKLDKPTKSSCPCLPTSKLPILVTKIVIRRGVNLSKKNGSDPNDINAYCVISCEGEKVTGPSVKQTANPEFNFSAIFYRRSPDRKPITIDVWNDNLMVDAFIGRIVLRQSEEVEGQIEEFVLNEKKDPNTPANTGSLVVVTYGSRNLQSL